MILITSSKHEIECSEVSTIENITVVAQTFSKVDELLQHFTKEELKKVTLNGIEYLNVTNIGAVALKNGDNVVITFNNKPEDEIEYIKRTLKDTEKALAEQSELVATLLSGEN